MAAVVRVKRRRNEDPVEILKVSCKRRKNDEGDAALVDENDRNEVESLLKFAATIPAKDTSISKHIRDAIRKEKLQKEYKQHSYNGDITVRKRQEQQLSSQSSRYKVLTSYRSLGLDDLDAATTNECITEQNGDNKKENNNKTTGTADIQRANNTEEISHKEHTDFSGSHGNCKTSNKSTKTDIERSNCEQNICMCKNSGDCCTVCCTKSPCNCSEHTKENSSLVCSTSGEVKTFSSGTKTFLRSESASLQSSEKMFCLYDVEKEKTENNAALTRNKNNSASAISEFTCNSVPMLRETVPQDTEEDYVYDLYYTNSSDFDFRTFENILRIEALQEDVLLDDRLDDDQYDEVYDEDDDSNDENNWRNDYPNEDPHFYENNDADNDEDTIGNHMFDHDEPLAAWMSSRCNIEDDGDESNDDAQSDQCDRLYPSSTYEQFLKRVSDDVDSLDD